MSPEDEALIARVQQHDDRHAFAELVRRYQSRLRYSLRQLTGYDEALADDLAQETFIKAYRNLRQFRGGSAFFTWLYRIAWRCFADHHRKRRPDEVATDSPLPDSPYESDERDALHMDFARALLHFAPEQRMALHLHLQREFTHREVAEIMDRPLGTVKSHIQRGRPILQQLLVDWET